MTEKPMISVIIKTFNEQAGIANTIVSIRTQLDALSLPYEILVADSLSTDATQEIALQHGATVIALRHANERCCGVGHQLGYLHARGEFLLLMDGDMQLEAGFIRLALDFLQTNPEYAGVAGTVEMDEAVSYEFQSRKQRLATIYPIGDCDHLGGGGMYRKAAVDDIGYLTNRNLHSYEEAELGMRLTLAGYKLHRLNVPYFYHHSYDLSTLALLTHRWRSGYLFGSGELLRGAFGKSHFKQALFTVKNALMFGGYLTLIALSLLSLNPALVGFALIPLLGFFILKTVRNCSVKAGAYSVLNLSMHSVGFFVGLFRPVKDPMAAPEHNVREK